MRKTNGCKGFTLVEMAIVLIIFGMLITLAIAALTLYYSDQNRKQTLHALESSKGALYQFLISEGRYPCPADPDLAPNHPDYGWEAAPCGDADSNDGHTVSGGTQAENKPAFTADADKDGVTDRILFGLIPFRTIEQAGIETSFFSAAETIDGWGNKITYAVPLYLTNADPVITYQDNYGALDVYDEFGNSLLNVIEDGDENGNGIPNEFLEERAAHAVLVSHGQNGKGAYTAGGVLVEFCTQSVQSDPLNPGAPPPGAIIGRDGDESENCDNHDEFFMGGLRTNDDDDYNDDYVRFLKLRTSELWAYTGVFIDDNGTPNDPSDDIKINKMANTNPGRIGIGTKEPEEMVHVIGDVKATEIMADSFCDSTGTNCFSADMIAGDLPVMKCSQAGEAVVSIEDEKVNCAAVFPAPALGTCPAGEYMVGISNTSGVICENL